VISMPQFLHPQTQYFVISACFRLSFIKTGWRMS
jgi:hypothetical protein